MNVLKFEEFKSKNQNPFTGTIIGHINKRNKNMDKTMKQLGFNSFNEYIDCSADINFSNSEATKLFNKWIKGDGTKAGLLRIKRTINCLDK